MIDIDTLRTLLRYEPDTGKLFWLPRPLDRFTSQRSCSVWNSRFAGQEAFTADNGTGYRRGDIFGTTYRAHRVIWALVTGAWPANEIDHRNGQPADNRWDNLREATRLQNSRNRRKAGGSSAYRGVSWSTSNKGWAAFIRTNGKETYIGTFPDEKKAAVAYDAAAIKHHGAFAKLNFPS